MICLHYQCYREQHACATRHGNLEAWTIYCDMNVLGIKSLINKYLPLCWLGNSLSFSSQASVPFWYCSVIRIKLAQVENLILFVFCMSRDCTFFPSMPSIPKMFGELLKKITMNYSSQNILYSLQSRGWSWSCND